MNIKNVFYNSKIKNRLLISTSLIITISIAVCTLSFYTQTKNAIIKDTESELRKTTSAIVSIIHSAMSVSVRNHLRAIAEQDKSIVELYYNDFLNGKISEVEAKKQVCKILRQQKIGQTGYVYIINSIGRIVHHPNIEYEGMDVTGFEFIRKQIKQKQGYLKYTWNAFNTTKTQSKASYMTYFAPWDWIISASAYRNEYGDIIDIKDFQSKVIPVKLGKSGYIFILDRHGNPIHHPWLRKAPVGKNQTVIQKFLKQIRTLPKGEISYKWYDQDSETPRNKIAAFEYIPELDWVIVASVYPSELFSLPKSIYLFSAIAMLLSILIAIPAVFFISKSITTPIEELTDLFSKAKEGDLSAKSKNKYLDEIGILARRFNLFMSNLKKTKRDLVSEVKIRQESEFRRKLFEEVFNNALEGITITDEHANIISVNKAFEDITGYSQHEAIGKNPRILKSDKHKDSFYAAMWNQLNTFGRWSGEIWNRRKNGEAYPEILSISAIRNSKGDTVNYIAVFHDITDKKQQEQQLEFQTHHDGLTHLPNKILLTDRISMALARTRKSQKKFALFVLDLDNFKNINDSLGHSVGDKLLKRAATRLKNLFTENETIARLGGDEFAIMVQDIETIDEITTHAERLSATFNVPFIIDANELHVTLSIGITVAPADGNSAEELIKNAEMAMYEAKNCGKNRYILYRSGLGRDAEKRLTIENTLRQALQNNELTVFYQPKINTKTKEIYGAEALVRWIKKDGTMIPPSDFIPLAEETGLVIKLGQQVMEIVKNDFASINSIAAIPQKISINLSPRQLKDENLLGDISTILIENEIPTNHIEFEITESMLMDDIEFNINILNKISSLGFDLSIDDFGTGHSSLNYLNKFPIDTIKIDRSFILEIPHNEEGNQIVKTIISMSENLQLDVIAEGVENQEQIDLLSEYGCSKAQGYFYAKPMPVEEYIDFLNANKIP